MTNADSAAIAVLVITPLVLVARAVVRRSRGLQFDAAEQMTAVGAGAIALAAIAITRTSSPAIFLTGGLAALGALLVVQSGRDPAQRSTRLLGGAAVALGLLGAVLMLVRAALG